MRITALFCFILVSFVYGCGESVPQQKEDDKNLSPVFQKKNLETESHGNLSKKNSITENKNPSNDSTNSGNKQKQNPISETINSVANYGTGRTHLTIKKKQEEKIKKIQDDYNSKINDAIKE